MERITRAFIIAFIRANEIELNATQSKLCLPVINRMFKKMSAGICFPGIKVVHNLICDGHHRYMASILAGYPIERIPGSITSATKEVHWSSVSFEEADWDTPAKIKILNEQDAEFNNIPVAEIMRLLE